MSGYIKLYRSLLDWEWYSDLNVCRLFLYCLLRANHKTEKWQGIVINAGQFVTSYENLSIETGLSVRQIRTALNKLKTTGELTNKTTSRYSMITIKNWDLYQANDKQNDKQATNKRQANDKQATTNNNEKNEKNIIEEEEERAPDIKNWYGEYSNVHLDNEQLGKLKSLILNDDFLFFLIDELSSNIAVGRAPRYDESQPWCHFAMVKKYWNFRKQNPGKFTKKAKKEGKTTAQIYEESKQRMLERMADDDII